jgi:hypothetical protein
MELSLRRLVGGKIIYDAKVITTQLGRAQHGPVMRSALIGSNRCPQCNGIRQSEFLSVPNPFDAVMPDRQP